MLSTGINCREQLTYTSSRSCERVPVVSGCDVSLAECGNTSPEIKFETLSGLLVVQRATTGSGELLLKMSLPLAPATDALPPSLTTQLDHNGPDSIGGVPPSR